MTGMTQRWRLVNNKELYDMANDPGQETNVMSDHPDVVARIRKAADEYWARVSPGDRERVMFIAGHPDDPETYLHPADWYLPMVPWSHGMVAPGPESAGTWWISTAQPGTYRFEVRRWPREAAAPITGVPKFDDPVDAWDAGGGKNTLIYDWGRTKFAALPVAQVRLRVGTTVELRPVAKGDEMVSFDLRLDQADYEVKSELLDADRKVLGGGYYVYCRRIGP